MYNNYSNLDNYEKKMETEKQNENRLLNIKNSFDKLTSENFTNWKLVLFWIVVFELLASMFEYSFIGHQTFKEVTLHHTLSGQLIVGLSLTGFVWMCVYNIIFLNKTNFLYLILFGTLGLYFVVTHDLYLQFLINNINPIHMFELGFGIEVMIELIFKFIIFYLIYELIVTLTKKR